jgi:hypothetical protein
LTIQKPCQEAASFTCLARLFPETKKEQTEKAAAKAPAKNIQIVF